MPSHQRVTHCPPLLQLTGGRCGQVTSPGLGGRIWSDGPPRRRRRRRLSHLQRRSLSMQVAGPYGNGPAPGVRSGPDDPMQMAAAGDTAIDGRSPPTPDGPRAAHAARAPRGQQRAAHGGSAPAAGEERQQVRPGRPSAGAAEGMGGASADHGVWMSS